MKFFCLLFLMLAAITAGGNERGWSIRRVANMPDGAPAFRVVSPSGEIASRIECIKTIWYDAGELSTRLLQSTSVMAAILEKHGALNIDDLGPAKFDCVVVFLDSRKLKDELR